MPGKAKHSEKWDRCWTQVQAKGHSPESAAAICTAQLGEGSYADRSATRWIPTVWFRDLGSEKSGNYGHAGRPGEVGGSAPSGGGATPEKGSPAYYAKEQARLKDLKAQWTGVNNLLLKHVQRGTRPDDPKIQNLMDVQRAIVKEMRTLDADPGGVEGLKMPGGARDVVIIGGGPGGLSTAINSATEGFDTVYVEGQVKAGGQSKFSSRIENYPGFPVGVTGRGLAESMTSQADRLGVEGKLGVRVTGIAHDPETGLKTVTLSNGETLTARSVVIAGGVKFHELKDLGIPGADASGVITMDGERLAREAAGKTAVVIGGSNGAAQAALGAAETANDVYLIARSPIAKSMSDYQIEAVRDHPKIHLIENDGIAQLFKDEHGHVTGAELKSGRKLDAAAVGVFIGGLADTSFLPKSIHLQDGKIDVEHRPDNPDRSQLETTMPGVFAVGDTRYGSIGRIGTAVADGQIAAKGAWDYFKHRLYASKKATTTQPRAAEQSSAVSDDEWNALVDALFDADAENPWIGQTVEPDELRMLEEELPMPTDVRELHLRGASGKVRAELYEGREHLVVPVIALMEGVIHAVNASEPEFVPMTALAASVHSWNGRPVVLGHPTRDGRQISANDPKVLENHRFGTIFQTRMENGRLCMEAWCDPKRLEALGAHDLLGRIRKGEPIEVSVGAHVRTEARTGAHGGKAYKTAWRELGSDHLAFLPKTRGACSIEMGCGALRASEEATSNSYTVYEVTQDGFRAAVGKRHNANDQEMVQQMHDHAVALGAECGGHRGAGAMPDKGETKKDCPHCDGMGQIKGKDCPYCDGTGKYRAAGWILDPERLRTFGGPGSGWFAEGGHVPGGQGGMQHATNAAKALATMPYDVAKLLVDGLRDDVKNNLPRNLRQLGRGAAKVGDVVKALATMPYDVAKLLVNGLRDDIKNNLPRNLHKLREDVRADRYGDTLARKTAVKEMASSSDRASLVK